MWLHLNSFVHKRGTNRHQAEVEAVDREIRQEFIIDRDGLSHEYSGVFQGTIARLLEKEVVIKQQWFSSIWMGRERMRYSQGLDNWHWDPLAATFITRASVGRKRKRGIE